MNLKQIIFQLTILLVLCSCNKKAKSINIEEGTKEINGTNLYYKIIGKGEPIVIIHGGPGLSHDYFLPGLIALTENHQLIFYDQRACGRSELNLDPESITLENFIKDLDELRAAFDIEKLNIMAHSWGGLLAINYASEYPDKLRSLIFVNSVGASSEIATQSNIELGNMFTPDDLKQREEILSSEAFKERSPKSIEDLMKLGFKHQFYNKSFLDSLNLAINENYMTTSSLLQGLGKDLKSYDYHSELNKIEVPCLLVYGSHDPLTRLAADTIHRSIKHSELVLIDESGHFPFIEKSNEFSDSINSFMASIE